MNDMIEVYFDTKLGEWATHCPTCGEGCTFESEQLAQVYAMVHERQDRQERVFEALARAGGFRVDWATAQLHTEEG